MPELRPDSRYNQDNAKIVEKFAIGVNTLGVVAQTKNVQGACTNYDVMSVIERFDWYMQNVPGTQSVISLPGMAKMVNAGLQRGQPQVAPAAARRAGDGAERDADRHRHGPAQPRLQRDAGAGQHHRPAGRDDRAPGRRR